MPIYRIKCAECGAEDEVIRKLAEYDNLPEHCGHKMLRMVCLPMVSADIGEYKSIVTGETIGSRSAHREHLRKHNLVEIGNEPIKQREYRGDHNLKPELVQAVKQVMGH